MSEKDELLKAKDTELAQVQEELRALLSKVSPIVQSLICDLLTLNLNFASVVHVKLKMSLQTSG